MRERRRGMSALANKVGKKGLLVGIEEGEKA